MDKQGMWHGWDRNVYRILVERAEKRDNLEYPRLDRDSNNIDLKEINVGRCDVD
jgi:hypothetical protein